MRKRNKIQIILFVFLLMPFAAPLCIAAETNVQSPHGIKAGGDVKITYGMSKETEKELRETLKLNNEQIKVLLKTLGEKEALVKDKDTKILEMAKKFKELEERLAARPSDDELAKKAKELLKKGDLDGAERLLIKSLEENLKTIKEMQKSAAADAYELGAIRDIKLDYQGAKKYYGQAASLEPENTTYLNNLGFVLATLGEYKKAIEYYTKALEIDLKVFGEGHPNTAIRYNNLGTAWNHLGEYKKAIEYYTKALEIDLKVFGEGHPKTAIRYNNLGTAWNHLDEYKKAKEYYKKSYEIFKEILGDDHPNTRTVKKNLDNIKQ